MDKSLEYILEIANKIHNEILINKSSVTLDDYISYLKQLKTYINHINFISNRIEQIYVSCSKEIYSNLKNVNNSLSEKQIKRIGTENWSKDILGKENFESKKTIISNSNPLSKHGNIVTNVKIVDNMNDIPNTQIYWINDIKQFGIRINNTIIRGNLGNINKLVEKNSLSSINTKLIECSFGSKCEKLKNDECKFYHDPNDLIKINKKIHHPIIRNFSTSSWMYDAYNNRKNKQMRHIGSKETLILDINKLKNNKRNFEIETNKIRNQCMHDILTLIVINNN